jgi:hypothetical protein
VCYGGFVVQVAHAIGGVSHLRFPVIFRHVMGVKQKAVCAP